MILKSYELKKAIRLNQSKYILIISLIWIVSAFVVNPIGGFPLNDDWAYSKNVYNLSELGVFKLSHWPAMTLVAQTLWGVVICKIFGFSFTVLRLSVLVLGWLGVVMFYILVRKMSSNNKLAFFLCMVLMLNPLYFSLAYTFMTDVPFIVVLFFSIYFFTRYLDEFKTRFILLSALFALTATLIRQLGIWIFITCLATYILTVRSKIRHLLLLLTMAIIPIFVLTIYSYFLKLQHIQPDSYKTFSGLFESIESGIQYSLSYRLGVILFFLGFFLLPVLIYLLPSFWIIIKPKIRWVSIVVSIILVFLIVSDETMIFRGNVLYNIGIGPVVLKDISWGINVHPTISNEFVTIIYIAGKAGSILLIFTLICSILNLNFLKKDSKTLDKIKIQSIFFILGYMVFLFLDKYFIDRYLLLLVPFFLFIIIPDNIQIKTLSSILAVVFLLFIGFFSVTATHDYLAWNKARWEGLNNLLKNGVSPHAIDGGFEFNAWYETGKKNKVEFTGKSWWFVDDDKYLVAFGDYECYDKIKTYKFKRYLTNRNDSIYILERKECKHDTTNVTCSVEKLSADQEYFDINDSSVYIINTNNSTDIESHTGKYAILIDKENPVGFFARLLDAVPGEKIRISVWHKYNAGMVTIVLASPTPKELYQSETIRENSEKEWIIFEYETSLPYDYHDNEVGFYFRNFGDNRALLDDLTIIRIKRQKK
jgi:hypothetical protein